MPAAAAVSAQLTAHLSGQLGAWPPARPVVVATSPARQRPGWDGIVRTFFGVRSPDGAVLSVPPDMVEAARAVSAGARDLEAARYGLESVLGGTIGEAAFRWSEEPADLPPLGEWVPATDERLPEWLHPFGGEALVAWDEAGRYVAGVGLKRHDEHAWEIAVGTEDAARGRGLARRLVVTAARHVLEQGKVPLYFHALDNEPSARVADASGFPDRGWRLLFLLPRAATDAP